MFSAGAGHTALDRLDDADKAPTSLFTRTLLPLMLKPGLSLLDMADEVGEKVRSLAQSVGHNQTPAFYSRVIGGRRVCLAGCGAVSPGIVPQATSAVPGRDATRQAPPTAPERKPEANEHKELAALKPEEDRKQEEAAKRVDGQVRRRIEEARLPRELYGIAHDYLFRHQDYAAEAAFEAFLRRYPEDLQAGEAQYWFGETLYRQQRYHQAAEAFRVVIERHQQNPIVPSSLLRIAQSLDQLGLKDCGVLDMLGRHLAATGDQRGKAHALKQKMGC
jgi:TolA-binding protein